MKKIILTLMIASLFFACSKEEQAGPSLKEIAETGKAKVSQDSVNRLLMGEWEEISSEQTRYRITVADSHFLLQELNPYYPRPAISLESRTYFYTCDQRFPDVYQMVDLTGMQDDIALSVMFKFVGDKLYLFLPVLFYYEKGTMPDYFRDLNESNAAILTRIK